MAGTKAGPTQSSRQRRALTARAPVMGTFAFQSPVCPPLSEAGGNLHCMNYFPHYTGTYFVSRVLSTGDTEGKKKRSPASRNLQSGEKTEQRRTVWLK